MIVAEPDVVKDIDTSFVYFLSRVAVNVAVTADSASRKSKPVLGSLSSTHFQTPGIAKSVPDFTVR